MKAENHKNSNLTQEEISDARRKESVERFKKLTDNPQQGPSYSFKAKTTAAILAWFLGCFGIHRLYIGKIGTGILMLIIGLIAVVSYVNGWLGPFIIFTFIAGIWTVVDFITIICGSMTDGDGNLIKE